MGFRQGVIFSILLIIKPLIMILHLSPPYILSADTIISP